MNNYLTIITYKNLNIMNIPESTNKTQKIYGGLGKTVHQK